MAIIKFTNNASSGAGSFAEAVKNAQPGDVIRPDEAVFERGSTVEIALISTLTLDKNLTLDAGPFRVRLNGGGAVRVLYVAAGATVRVVGFDFVGAVTTSSGGGVYAVAGTSATFERCAILGCSATYGGGAYLAGTAEFRDCLVAGCKATTGGGLFSSGATTLNGSTVAGCVASSGAPCARVSAGSFAASNSILSGAVVASISPIYAGSVVAAAPSEIGFAAPPPNDLNVDNWSDSVWQNWDLRLLDDASPNPSPYRDSGEVDAATEYDVDGNFRGRVVDGSSTCSPGAYETLQADLFWIGDGWSASRFASAPGDAAPQAGQTFFVDGAARLDDAPAFATLRVGGRATVSTGDVASQLDLSLGLGATFGVSTSATLRRLGAFAKLDWTSGALTVAVDAASSELTVPPGATLTVAGARFTVDTLEVGAAASVVFTGDDAILAATGSATVGAATFGGRGYFATPPGTTLTAATFGDEARACDYGAGVSAFSAVATSATQAALEWSRANQNATVCVERETATGWEVVDARASSTLETTIITPGVARFRLFDGENFLYDVAWYLTGDQFTAAGFCYATTTNETSSVEYETRGRIVATNTNGLIYCGQSVTFIQRIANAFTGELLKNDGGNVTAVKYSLYKRDAGLFTNSTESTPIFENRDAPPTCVLEAPQTSEAWNEDGAPVEYNFVLTPPNSITEPFLPSPGEYFLRVAVELSTGNPIISIFEFSVL